VREERVRIRCRTSIPSACRRSIERTSLRAVLIWLDALPLRGYCMEVICAVFRGIHSRLSVEPLCCSISQRALFLRPLHLAVASVQALWGAVSGWATTFSLFSELVLFV